MQTGRPAKKKREKAQINYVWINARPDRTDRDAPMLSVPIANLEKAMANANRYPEAHFNIWIDQRLIGASTQFWLTSYIYAQAQHGNVRVRNLQDIPAYRDDPFFIPPDKKRNRYTRHNPRSPYLRADYARILVLDHCLTQKDRYRYIVYSDFDCADIKLPEIAAGLQKNAVVINNHGRAVTTSNGFIGLDKRYPGIQGLFAPLCEETRKDVVACRLGYTALQGFIEAIHPDYKAGKPRLMLPLLPPMHTKLQPSDFATSLGLN